VPPFTPTCLCPGLIRCALGASPKASARIFLIEQAPARAPASTVYPSLSGFYL
jgi:hypothetical protein